MGQVAGVAVRQWLGPGGDAGLQTPEVGVDERALPHYGPAQHTVTYVGEKRVSVNRHASLGVLMGVGMEIRELAAVVATVLATVGALPQLRRLLTSRDLAGLSISSAALGVATELAWVGYTVHEGLWLAVPEAVMMASTNGLLAVVMLRAGAPGRRALLSGIAWAATLIATSAVCGLIGLAVLLAVAYVVQVSPAIWSVYRATCPSGVAVGTWVTIGFEAVLWGLYGWWSHDVACLAFGVAGTAAAVAIVGRVVTTRRRLSASGVDDRREPPAYTEPALGIGDALPEVC